MIPERLIYAAYFGILCAAIATYRLTIPAPHAVGTAVWVCIVASCAAPLLMMVVVATEAGKRSAEVERCHTNP